MASLTTDPNRPKLYRDMVGRRVRLIREITTRGGNVFPAGTEMKVYSTWRGALNLNVDPNPRPGYCCPGIRQVLPRQVEFIA
jgi:hypothetical protein